MILADIFTKQLRKLTAQEQGLVSKAVLFLNSDPANPKWSLHKVKDGKDDWWSATVNMDLRIILKRQLNQELVVCWVDHHDAAYAWAEKHVLGPHPVTGNMQLVEIPEVAAIPTPTPASAKSKEQVPKPCAKLGIKRDDLLAFGMPELWVDKVLDAACEDDLLGLSEHLPADAAEAVLKIAIGERPEVTAFVEPAESAKPFESQKEKQSWLVITDDDELSSVLLENWETWMIYLHPSQRDIAERLYNGPVRVSGSAGTGKTVVALHHARFLLRADPAARLLIVTFSVSLVNDLTQRCRPLFKPKELERCDIHSFRDFGLKAYNTTHPGHPRVLSHGEMQALARQVITAHESELPKGINAAFVLSEWERVVDVRNLTAWEDYRDAVRRGVPKRLAEQRRAALWTVFELIRAEMRKHFQLSAGEMFGELTEWYRAHPDAYREYTHIVVDESQDMCEVELAFLTAYAQGKDALFFAGDIGQRIIRYSFPWKPFGIDLRGKTRILKVNYRTTHQIRSMADLLMDNTQNDADDIPQNRVGTVSLLSGPQPVFRQYETTEEEAAGVAAWLNGLKERGVPGNAVAIFFRSEHEHERAKIALNKSAYAGERARPDLCTMFDAKGLEYQAAIVMACDCDVLPSPERLAEADLVAGMQEIYDTERNLLYVACTRARDSLLITSAGTPSELLLDMSLSQKKTGWR